MLRFSDIEQICCKLLTNINNKLDRKFINEVKTKANADSFFEFAKQNDVAPQIAHALIDNFKPENISQKWINVHKENYNKISIYLKELDHISSVFSVNGMSLVALKNGGIARAIYPCPGCCPMGDLDLMIEKHNFRYAHSLLLNQGYHFEFRSHIEENDLQNAEEDGGSEYWKILPNGEKLWLELQWRPVAGRWIRLDQEPRAEVLMANSAAIPNTKVRLLSPEDNLLQVCLHTAKHSYMRGIGIRLHTDVDRIVRYQTINWKAFLDTVIKKQVKTSVFFSLAIPKQIFDTPIPEDVIKKIQPATWKRKIIYLWLNRAGLFNPNERKFSKVGYIIFTSLLYDDFRGLLRSIFPEKKWMREKYKTTNNVHLFFQYFKRLIDLAIRRANT